MCWPHLDRTGKLRTQIVFEEFLVAGGFLEARNANRAGGRDAGKVRVHSELSTLETQHYFEG
jgi:hypothetical protein